MSGSVNISDSQRIQQLMQEWDLGPTESIGLMFAKLQLSQAQICKEKAKTLMNEITNIQADQKKCAEMIAQARKLQQEAKTKGGCTNMPQEMWDYFKSKGIPWEQTGNDNIHNEKEWDFNIQSLTNYQETIANGTQTLLMQVQDFIGQYNSYESGASSAIDKANQVTQTILQK